jgi:hypothetical protein
MVAVRMTRSMKRNVPSSRKARLVGGVVVLAVTLGACSGGEERDRTAASNADCLAQWNGQENEKNRAEVASSGEYAVAAARQGAVGKARSRGCGYVFHTEIRHASYRGVWKGQTLDWNVLPTLRGRWDAGLERRITDNALVLDDGSLTEIAAATASWSERDCQRAGKAETVSYELCFRGGRGAHGSFIAVRDGARRLVSIRPPHTRSPTSPIVGHWAWAAVSPDGATLLAQWSAECAVPYAFFVPLASGEPRPLSGGPPWYDQLPSEALGWSTEGRPLVRLWKSECGRNDGRLAAYLTTSGELRPLPCLVGRLEPAVEPRSVRFQCGRTASQPGSRLCGPRDADPPCGPGALPGVAYPYELRTHCGIADTFFDGRFWVADPPLDDGSHNPPRGWDNPTQEGTISLLAADRAQFRSDRDLVARFRPAPASYESAECD